MRAVLISVLLAMSTIGPTNVVSADPNVEYGEEYEAAYLAACSVNRPLAACQCSMEVIEDTISFNAFAALVEHHGGDIRRAVPAARVDPTLERRCGIATLSLPLQTGMAPQ